MLCLICLLKLEAQTSGAINSKANWAFQDGTLTISCTEPTAVAFGEPQAHGGRTREYWSHIGNQVTRLVVEEGITDIGGRLPFYSLTSCKHVSLPESLTSLSGIYLFEKTPIDTLIIPKNVTYLGQGFCVENNNIKVVEVPAGVTSFGTEVFSRCHGFRKFINHCSAPQSLGYDAFFDSYLRYANLYVPAAYVELYKSTPVWNTFKAIYEIRDRPANLASLAVTLATAPVTLSPSFHPDTLNYTFTVSNSVTGITVAAAPARADATVTGTGPVTLNAGDNILPVKVTEDDGTEKTYTVTVRRKSIDATLKSLSIIGGILSPAFTASTFNYTVRLPYSNIFCAFIAKTNHALASATGLFSDEELEVGDNIRTVTVTSEEGNTQTYTVTVHRISNDASLKSLAVTGGTLSPAFAANIFNYTVSVPNATASVTLAAGANYALASVTGAGLKTLDAADSAFPVTVRAEDGLTARTYTVTVHRKSIDATLKSITLNNGNIPLKFDPATLSYTVAVPNSISSLTVNAETNHFAATIISGTGVRPLSAGNNILPVEVSSEDGIVEIYTLKVYRLLQESVTASSAETAIFKSAGDAPKSGDATLWYFYLLSEGHNYTYMCEPDQRVYSMFLTGTQTSFTFGAVPKHPLAAAPPESVFTVPAGGTIEFTFIITAEDGTEVTYHIQFYHQREGESHIGNPFLQYIHIEPGTLVPPFHPDTFNYSATVGYSADSIKVSYARIWELTAVTVDGLLMQNGKSRPVDVGDNLISINTVSEDESATALYTVAVHRKSNDATLKTLTLNNGDIQFPFNPAIHSYAVTVPYSLSNIIIDMRTNHESAGIISIMGKYPPFAGNYARSIALAVGDTVLSITVAAEDTTFTETYTVAVRRRSNDATLKSLTLNSGAIPLEFNPAIHSYTVTVPYSVSSLTVNVETSHSSATVTSGTESHPLSVGDNDPITVTVMSEDGNTETYTLAVRRQSSDASLKILTLNNGDIQLPFDPVITNYMIAVPNTVSGITVDAETNHEFAGIISGTGEYQLSAGNNTLSVEVVAEDIDSTRTYTFTVRRRSNDASLKSLALNNGDVPLEFDPSITGYTLSVSNSVSNLTVDAITNHEFAVITAGTGNYPLPVGDTVLSVTVSAEDTAYTETYTVAVHRKSTDASLKSLTLNNGDIQFGFDPATFSYTVPVSSSVSSLAINAEPNHKLAVVTAGAGIYPLSGKDRVFEIEVTSEDGTVEIYTVSVICLSNDARLKSLTLNKGAVPLLFYTNSLKYRVEVEDEVTDITIDCAANHPEATVSGDGYHPLSYGDNVFPVTVIAEDRQTDERTTLVYTVTVHRTSNDITLKSLTAAPAELVPPFNPDITQYTANVPDSVSSITVDVETNYLLATCLISKGDDFGEPGIKQLNAGKNVFGISIFSENKKYYKTYWVSITREATPVITGFDEAGTPAAAHVYTADGRLYVDSPAAERINIYSVTGTLLYGFDKPAGVFTFPAFAPSPFHSSPVLIVKGSSGWARKLVVSG